jgi:hypothetical protein
MKATVILGIILAIAAIVYIYKKINPNRSLRHGRGFRFPTFGKVDGHTRSKLTRLLGGNQKTIDRLISQCRFKYPNKSEQWYWEKVLYDLERDRWR